MFQRCDFKTLHNYTEASLQDQISSAEQLHLNLLHIYAYMPYLSLPSLLDFRQPSRREHNFLQDLFVGHGFEHDPLTLLEI